MNIQEIKKEFAAADISFLPELIARYEGDSRKGVVQAVEGARQRMNKYKSELARLEQMHQYENQYSEYEGICGIDEVGRGPYAGPVVAAAVILPKDCNILYVNDSKKLSEKKREELYEEIMEKALSVGIGMASPQVIDEINILNATYKAMQQAVRNGSIIPDILLNDAVTIPDMPMKQVPIIKGDAKSISIACASIIAKVTRDRMMVEYDKTYPEYGFASHKGYGSKQHEEAIQKYGITPIHRKTFVKKFLHKEEI